MSTLWGTCLDFCDVMCVLCFPQWAGTLPAPCGHLHGGPRSSSRPLSPLPRPSEACLLPGPSSRSSTDLPSSSPADLARFRAGGEGGGSERGQCHRGFRKECLPSACYGPLGEHCSGAGRGQSQSSSGRRSAAVRTEASQVEATPQGLHAPCLRPPHLRSSRSDCNSLH